MRTRNEAAILSLLLVAFLAPSAVAGGAAEDATLDILADTIRANRKALVAVNLRLEDAEAVDFWPVYDRYQKDLALVSDRLVGIIEDYSKNFATMSDENAAQLLARYLAVEQERADLRQKYLAPFSAVLRGRKVARLYQIENKMDAIVRYELAREIPVVEQ
jgi:hypothetical protein